MALSRRVKLLIPIAFFIVLGALFAKKYLVAPNLKLSDITISNLIEEQSNLGEIPALKNKVVVFNAWATWCPPCIEEMPIFDSLFIAYADTDVEFILASDEEITKLAQFTRSKALTVPLYHLPYSMKELGIYTFPSTFVFDKKGKLVHTKIGKFESAEVLKAMIEPLR